jgi:hypothetical protein
MPVITDALIGDTTHLSTEQFGAYVLILIATWRNNGQALADDDESMAHICRCSLARWRKHLRPKLIPFFDLADGHWHQKRLEAEWALVMGKIEKQRKKARGRWVNPPIPFDVKSLKPQETPDAAAYAAAMPAPGVCHPESEVKPLTEDSPCLSNPESAAAREIEKDTGENPGARCARLGGKSPELKHKIKRQLAVKHCRFLTAQFRWDELAEYHEAMKAGENGLPRQDLFDAVDARMRRAGWDDMRWWRELERRPRDLAPDPHSIEAMMLRKGWYHGKAA